MGFTMDGFYQALEIWAWVIGLALLGAFLTRNVNDDQATWVRDRNKAFAAEEEKREEKAPVPSVILPLMTDEFHFLCQGCGRCATSFGYLPSDFLCTRCAPCPN
jgi:hypothetical protein